MVTGRGARLHVRHGTPPTRATRINIGIRRRLAPLLDNDIGPRSKLMNGMLLSMPGSPILYYGDEIGMGDNIFARRPRRRAHAHAVEPGPQRRLLRAPTRGKLYLPAIQDPVYGYESAQRRGPGCATPASLLHWTTPRCSHVRTTSTMPSAAASGAF